MIKSSETGSNPLLIDQNRFYKDPGKLDMEEQKRSKWLLENYNFDCPDAIDWDLFIKCLDELRSKKSCMAPIFDDIKKIR